MGGRDAPEGLQVQVRHATRADYGDAQSSGAGLRWDHARMALQDERQSITASGWAWMSLGRNNRTHAAPHCATTAQHCARAAAARFCQ